MSLVKKRIEDLKSFRKSRFKILVMPDRKQAKLNSHHGLARFIKRNKGKQLILIQT